MEEIKTEKHCEKLSYKDKKRFQKLYLKYKNNEKKVIEIMKYEEKMEKVGFISVLISAYIIYSIQSDLNNFYFSGGFSGLEYLLLLASTGTPLGMGIYKFLYISKEINRIISIVVSVIISFIISSMVISWMENFIMTVITM